MIREPFRGTWRPISLDRMQSGAFYDSTRWRCAKGLPPRDKCCHPFRSQLTRAPPFTRSHYRRKTDEWIGAWIIFHFEILAVLRRIRLLREPDRFLLPFYSHGDRCDPSYRYCFDSRHGEYLSLSLRVVSIPLDAVQKGTLKWESSLGLSPYRSVVRFVELRNEYDIYRPGGILTERNDVIQHTVRRHPFYYGFPVSL